MTTLAAIRKQIAELQKKADAIAKAEARAAAQTVRELIARHNLTADDVGLSGGPGKPKAKAVKAKAPGVPKYRDPATGKTWTGTGKPPAWIADAKNRSKFLIESEAASQETATTATKPKARAPKAVRGAKAATVKTAKVTKAPMATKVAARKGAGKKAAAKAPVDAASAKSSTVDTASAPAPTGA